MERRKGLELIRNAVIAVFYVLLRVLEEESRTPGVKVDLGTEKEAPKPRWLIENMGGRGALGGRDTRFLGPVPLAVATVVSHGTEIM